MSSSRYSIRSSCTAVALAAACAAVLCGCEAEVAVGAIGSSLALLPAGRLVVVDPDQGSVSLVDADTLALLDRVTVGDEPRALVRGEGDRVYVAVRRSGELVELGTDGGLRIERRAHVCTGPRALARGVGGDLFVACEWDGSVQRIDPITLTASVIARALERPIAIAQAGTAVFVLEAQRGRLVRIEEGVERAVSIVPAPSDAPERPALAQMTAHNAAALAILDGGRTVVAAYELVNASGEGNGEAIVDNYGSVTDGTPKINPALRGWSTADFSSRATPTAYARYDAAPALRSNGPSALAVLDEEHVLLAHRSSRDLAVVALVAESGDARRGSTYAVGAGPSGIAIDRERGIAWTDDALDGAISRVDLRDSEGAAVTTQLRGLQPVASTAALLGRRSFFDATNAHLSPAGVIACATCHPEGGDDATVWFIRPPGAPEKRRATPHLANASAATAPYHWDAQYADRSTLVHATVVDLMAGDGLLIDDGAITAYLDELVRAPVATPIAADAIARGATLFARAGCAGCHPAPLYTDRLRHAVLAEAPAGPNSLVMADTPGLLGVGARARFFHDGRASSLAELLVRSDATAHGSGASLAADERADLIAFLRSL